MTINIALDLTIARLEAQANKKPAAKADAGKRATLSLPSGQKIKYVPGADNDFTLSYQAQPLVDFSLVPFAQQIDNIEPGPPTPPPPAPAQFTVLNGVVDAPASAPQIRATFASAEVGNGNTKNVAGDLAVALQLETTSGTLTGTVVRVSDEGVTYTAKNGQTFDVRDVSGTQRGDQFTHVVLGTNQADTLQAAATPSYLNAGAGNDTLTGGAGADFLVGGAGDDRLIAGAGDKIIGGDGTDVVELTGNSGDYTVTDTTAAVTLTNANGVVTLVKTGGTNSTESAKFADGTFTLAELLAPAKTIALTTTLNAADSIDLGGGLDRAEFELNADFAGFTTGKMVNVETLALSTTGTTVRTFNGTNTSADLSRVELTGAINLTGLNSVVDVAAGARTADLSVTFAANVTNANNDSMTLELTDVGINDDLSTAPDETETVALNIAGIETITTVLSGANQLDATNLAATVWELSGDGGAVITEVSASLRQLDASQVQGDLDIDLGNTSVLPKYREAFKRRYEADGNLSVEAQSQVLKAQYALIPNRRDPYRHEEMRRRGLVTADGIVPMGVKEALALIEREEAQATQPAKRSVVAWVADRFRRQ